MCCRMYVLRMIRQRSIPLFIVGVDLGAENHGGTIAPNANILKRDHSKKVNRDRRGVILAWKRAVTLRPLLISN